MKVFYSDKMVATQGKQSFGGIQSPSARKPKEVVEALKALSGIEIVEPKPLSIDDFKLCHNPSYVDDVMSLKRQNGFGTISQEICDSLPYTNGAMYDAALSATPEMPTAALVSGFHHAGYNGWEKFGWFCTFNGLVISAMKYLKENTLGIKKCVIIDCDMHWGNGTADILENNLSLESVNHISFGHYFKRPKNADDYMNMLVPSDGGNIYNMLKNWSPCLVLYQAGADVHINDPYGGVLTTEQIMERDRRMFSIAKELKLPLAWDLAGGYQIDPDGSIDKVVDIHMNTFKAAKEVYGF